MGVLGDTRACGTSGWSPDGSWLAPAEVDESADDPSLGSAGSGTMTGEREREVQAKCLTSDSSVIESSTHRAI